MMNRLDPDQQRAASHDSGNACVAAAAGSGKTTLLVARAIRLVEAGAHPSTVLTLCFNRNAQQTLVERFRQHPATAGAAESMASTFHAFALKAVMALLPKVSVLATSAAEAARVERSGQGRAAGRTVRDVARQAWTNLGGFAKGQAENATLAAVDYDTALRLEPLVRESLFEHGYPDVLGDATQLRQALQRLRTIINDAEYTEEMRAALALLIPAIRTEKLPNVRNNGRREVDFADMLLGLGGFIRQEDPRVMTLLAKYRHVQVDEAQDGNYLRWFITRAFAALPGEGRSVLAVGDLRQAIAGFTGARPAMFRKWWDESTQYNLPRNYRSARRIVEAGNVVARGESWNLGGDCVAARADLGEGRVEVRGVSPLAIGLEIASDLANGVITHKDVSVLARTRASLELVAFALRARGVRAFVRGGGGLWNSLLARAFRAYLHLADGGRVPEPADAVSALNHPVRFVSRELMSQWVLNGHLNPSALAQTVSRGGRMAQTAVKVQKVMRELRGLSWEATVAYAVAQLQEGLIEEQANRGAPEGAETDYLELVESLRIIAVTCGSAANLEAAIAADGRVSPDAKDVVVLSTIHMAKGDQWNTVYVSGLKRGTFPSARAVSDAEVAEEMRLLYVAVTRPVSRLVLCTMVDDTGTFEPKLRQLRNTLATRTDKGDVTPELPAPALPATTKGEAIDAENFVERWQGGGQLHVFAGLATNAHEIGRSTPTV